MLINYEIKNFKTFNDKITISFYADMRIKKFEVNTTNIDGINILKTIGIYGPNNTGKSCLIEGIYTLRSLMLGEPHYEFYNSFINNYVTEIEAIYENNNNYYKYSLRYDSKSSTYLYERLDKLLINKSFNFSSDTIFERSENSIDIRISNFKRLPLNLLNNKLPFFMILKFDNTELEEVQKDYISFASSINLINMSITTPVEKTLELIQKDERAKKFIKSFAKNCDLNIEDFGYSNDIISDVDINNKISRFNQYPYSNKELLKIWSKHHGYIVPSVFFDSVGTRKLISLAGYIYESIVNNGILLIDELDSSLHHIIIRAIIALFNNELNKKTQLVFTTHDAMTMDLRRLFRKDQIYLTDINKKGENTIIHLSKDFTSRGENGVRGDEDVVDYYLKGRFGAIPTPDLFDSLYEVTNET